MAQKPAEVHWRKLMNKRGHEEQQTGQGKVVEKFTAELNLFNLIWQSGQHYNQPAGLW